MQKIWYENARLISRTREIRWLGTLFISYAIKATVNTRRNTVQMEINAQHARTKRAQPRPVFDVRTWTTLPYVEMLPSRRLQSCWFCFFSKSAACYTRWRTETSSWIFKCHFGSFNCLLTCSFLSSNASVAFCACALPLLAFQNCFCAEYRFIGHTRNKQSGSKRQTRTPG